MKPGKTGKRIWKNWKKAFGKLLEEIEKALGSNLEGAKQ